MIVPSLLATTPTPTPSPSFDEDLVSPGPVGFLAILLVTIATVLLILDMVRRIRRVRYRSELRERRADDPQP